MAVSAESFVQQLQGQEAKTRTDPLDPQLVEILNQVAARTGVVMQVYSGGQDDDTGYTGSVRHDHGKAADVRLYVRNDDGTLRRLDASRASDVPILQDVAKYSFAYGANGVGMGPDYMGNGSMHIGFGLNPANHGKVATPNKDSIWGGAPFLAAARSEGVKLRGTIPPMNIPQAATQLDTTPPRSPTISKATQDALRQAGFNPGASDGINGLKTQAAIKAFQSANGLKVDGIVGKNTLAALQRATAASQSAPSPLPSRGVVVAHPSVSQPIVPSGPQGRSSRGNTAAPQTSNGFNGLLNAGRALGSTLTTLGTAAGSIANAVNPRAQPVPPRYVPAAPRRSTPMPSVAPQGPQGRGRSPNAFLRPYGTPGMSTITVNGGRVTYAPPTPRAVPPTIAVARGGEGGNEVRYESTGAAGQPIYVAPGQSQQFVDSVTRASNMPGVNAFTGTVQEGSGGQNRYGSTAHNELMAQFGF